MKARTVNIKDLDASCWTIQLWGKEHCKTCLWNGTRDCGGNSGNAEKIKTGKMKAKSRVLGREK